jgi:hypothetical protein
LLGVLLATQAAVATVAPVGLLESVDIELIQGNQTVFHATNINTTGMLGGTPIYLQTIGDTQVFLQVQADQPGVALEPDRWMQFTIQGRDLTGTTAANLFTPQHAGEIQLKITNMKFDNVDGVNGNRIEPFNPGQYAYPQSDKPFFYIFDGDRGFVNLPGSEQYSPGKPWNDPYYLESPSVQVPMYVWASPDWDYGFTQVDNGHLTGFHLSGVPDYGADALALTPILPDALPPYFGPSVVPDPEYLGSATEISVNLNMRGYVVPEPTSLLLFLLPLWMRITRKTP